MVLVAIGVVVVLSLGCFICGKYCGKSEERKKHGADAVDIHLDDGSGVPDPEQPRDASAAGTGAMPAHASAPAVSEDEVGLLLIESEPQPQPQPSERVPARVVARVQSQPKKAQGGPPPIPRGVTPPREGGPATPRGATPPRDRGGAPKQQSTLKQYAALSQKVIRGEATQAEQIECERLADQLEQERASRPAAKPTARRVAPHQVAKAKVVQSAGASPPPLPVRSGTPPRSGGRGRGP